MEKGRKGGGLFRTLIVLSLIVIVVKYYYPDFLEVISDKVSEVRVVTNNTDIQYMSTSATNELNLVSLEVPEEADEYAKQMGASMLSSIKGSEALFGVSINNYDDLYLGEPYTIMPMDSSVTTSDVYYYPICEDGSIKLILSIYKNNGEWNSTIGTDIADELNKLNADDGSQYLLYYSNGTIYAETASDKSKLYVDEDVYNPEVTDEPDTYESKVKQYSDSANGNIRGSEINRRRPEYSFFNVEFQSAQIKTITDDSKESDSVFCNVKEKTSSLFSSISSFFESDGISTELCGEFLVDKSDMRVLNTSDCLVGQLDAEGNPRGMCWAASVATIVRYMTGDSKISAEDVCAKMNVGLDDGGDIDIKKKALAVYGLDYTKLNSQMTWGQLKENIDNKKPIAISSFSNTDGHAVTIIGYSEANNNQTILFWNSGNQKMQAATYSGEQTIYSYNSYTWKWAASLY